MALNRELLSLTQLSEWMTSELQKNEDCEGSTVRVQYKLQKPDADGCNWSDSVVFSPGPKVSKETLTGLVGDIVRAARVNFNVKD